MKKLLLLSIITFAIGCGKKADAPKPPPPPAPPATTTTQVTNTTKAPAIKLEIKSDATKINAEIKVTDEDSDAAKIVIYAIHFEKGSAPAQKDIDWSKATKITNLYSISNPEDGKIYVIFVQAIDETKNQTVATQEYTFKKPEAGAKPGDVKPGDGGAQPAGTTTQPAATSIDVLQDFIKDLCGENEHLINEANNTNLKKLCDFTFTDQEKEFVIAEETYVKLRASTTELDLSAIDFNLEKIPESIGELTNLKILDLSMSKIKELPESIGKLTNLETLDLNFNDIVSPPESIGKLTNLKYLNLSMNGAQPIPAWIENLTNLETFGFRGNSVHQIPESIGKLTNLKDLDLSINDIVELPNTICTLTNMDRMSFERNKIEQLPDCLGDLSNLEYVYFDINKIKTLPDSLYNLKKIEYLSIYENPLTAETKKKLKATFTDKVILKKPK